MSTQNQPHSESEIVTFLEKLAEFHSTLSSREQSLMDDITVAALSAPKPEVQGYSATPLFQNLFTSAQVQVPTAKGYYYYRNVASRLGGAI